jgi:hypothetical protein
MMRRHMSVEHSASYQSRDSVAFTVSSLSSCLPAHCMGLTPRFGYRRKSRTSSLEIPSLLDSHRMDGLGRGHVASHSLGWGHALPHMFFVQEMEMRADNPEKKITRMVHDWVRSSWDYPSKSHPKRSGDLLPFEARPITGVNSRKVTDWISGLGDGPSLGLPRRSLRRYSQSHA